MPTNEVRQCLLDCLSDPSSPSNHQRLSDALSSLELLCSQHHRSQKLNQSIPTMKSLLASMDAMQTSLLRSLQSNIASLDAQIQAMQPTIHTIRTCQQELDPSIVLPIAARCSHSAGYTTAVPTEQYSMNDTYSMEECTAAVARQVIMQSGCIKPPIPTEDAMKKSLLYESNLKLFFGQQQQVNENDDDGMQEQSQKRRKETAMEVMASSLEKDKTIEIPKIRLRSPSRPSKQSDKKAAEERQGQNADGNDEAARHERRIQEEGKQEEDSLMLDLN